ncbi:MAG: dNTP triphosphohydrolase [Gammaproteobacteria bacterium]|nr:dNTP triphosphohydrolase [Gammaproteobacteria bacterium]
MLCNKKIAIVENDVRLYTDRCVDRDGDLSVSSQEATYKNPFRLDYRNLIRSDAFRRLAGKTQMFPVSELECFRNRLTHSLEVAEIAVGIAERINRQYSYFIKNPLDLSLIETAALAHDIGHPPFGHEGERALDRCMKDYGGFNSNAQTVRLLSRIEGASMLGEYLSGMGDDLRQGLNFTYRTLAAVIKYDQVHAHSADEAGSADSGYYRQEMPLVNRIKMALLGNSLSGQSLKTVECHIMDVADDIANACFDLDDALRSGHVNPCRLFNFTHSQLVGMAKKISKSGNAKEIGADEVFEMIQIIINEYGISQFGQFGGAWADISVSRMAECDAARKKFIQAIVSDLNNEIEVELNVVNPVLTKVSLSEKSRLQVALLKAMVHESLVNSPGFRAKEFINAEVVSGLFSALTTEISRCGRGCLLPEKFRAIYQRFELIGDKEQAMRQVCDYIACLTDKQAIETYRQLRIPASVNF